MSFNSSQRSNGLHIDCLITDTNNIPSLQQIISNKHSFPIHIITTQQQQPQSLLSIPSSSSITLSKKSYNTIQQLSSLFTPEYLIFTQNHKRISNIPHKSHGNFALHSQYPNQNDDSSSNDDSFVANIKRQPNNNPTKIIIDSEDINIEERVKISSYDNLSDSDNEDVEQDEYDELVQYNGTAPNNETTLLRNKKNKLTLSSMYASNNNYNSNKIDYELLLRIHKQSIFMKYYDEALILWEVLFMGSVLLGLNMVIYLTLFIVVNQMWKCFYVGYIAVMAVMMFVMGMYGIIKMVKEEESDIGQKGVCDGVANGIVGLCLGMFYVIEEGVNKEHMVGLRYMKVLIWIGIGVGCGIVIMNCKMRELYREYEWVKEKYVKNNKMGGASQNKYRLITK